jgi:hypothetical protein
MKAQRRALSNFLDVLGRLGRSSGISAHNCVPSERTDVRNAVDEPSAARSVLLALLFIMINAAMPIALIRFADDIFDDLGVIIGAYVLLSLCDVLFLLSEFIKGLKRLKQRRYVPVALHFIAGSSVMMALVWSGDLTFLGRTLDFLFL